MSSLEGRLDRLHSRARGSAALQRLAIVSRIMLALSFIPTGLVKLQGDRFTSISIENPVGAFFEAMYQTGMYWRFLGLSQLVAGVFVLIPRTTVLGAVMFFPIVLNIFIITIAIDFKGTPLITGPMLLASLFLLCWHYDRLKPVLWAQPEEDPSWRVTLPAVERIGYAMGVVGGLGVLAGTRSLLGGTALIVSLGVGALGVLMVAAGWWQMMRSR